MAGAVDPGLADQTTEIAPGPSEPSPVDPLALDGGTQEWGQRVPASETFDPSQLLPSAAPPPAPPGASLGDINAPAATTTPMPNLPVPAGYDAAKWNDPTYQSAKYVAGRIIAGGGTIEQAAAAVGAVAISKDKIRFPDGNVYDAIFDVGGQNLPAWIYIDPNPPATESAATSLVGSAVNPETATRTTPTTSTGAAINPWTPLPQVPYTPVQAQPYTPFVRGDASTATAPPTSAPFIPHATPESGGFEGSLPGTGYGKPATAPPTSAPFIPHATPESGWPGYGGSPATPSLPPGHSPLGGGTAPSAGPATPESGWPGYGSTPAQGQADASDPNTNPLYGQFNTALRDRLTQLMDPNGLSADAPEIRPSIDAYRLRSQRGLEQTREQLAGAAYARGDLNSGSYATDQQRAAEEASMGQAAFTGQAVQAQQVQRAQSLQALLQTGATMLTARDQQNLQRELAQLDAGLRQQGIDFNYAQLGEQSRQFGSSQDFNYAQLNQQADLYLRQLAQQQNQFGGTMQLSYDQLGQNRELAGGTLGYGYAALQAEMNRQALLAAMGG